MIQSNKIAKQSMAMKSRETGEYEGELSSVWLEAKDARVTNVQKCLNDDFDKQLGAEFEWAREWGNPGAQGLESLCCDQTCFQHPQEVLVMRLFGAIAEQGRESLLRVWRLEAFPLQTILNFQHLSKGAERKRL